MIGVNIFKKFSLLNFIFYFFLLFNCKILFKLINQTIFENIYVYSQHAGVIIHIIMETNWY